MRLSCAHLWGLVLAGLLAWTHGRTARRTGGSQLSAHPRLAREVGCPVNCTAERPRPVCGTDGRTYRSKCEIKRLRRCEGQRVRVQEQGRCRHRGLLRLAGPLSEGGRCLEERAQALQGQSGHVASGVYVPECRTDGSFAAVQCHAATNSCWCVTRDGRPIPGSSVWGRRINCKRNRGREQTPDEPVRLKGGCNSSDRAAFTANLLRLFSEEYARIPKPTPPAYPGAPKDLPIRSESAAVLVTPERRVLEWKFTELDTVKDDMLSKIELRSLLRMLKKLVRPKACAKSFAENCDIDQDGGISRAEWSTCLAGQPDNAETTSPPSDGPAPPPSGGLLTHLLRSSSEAQDEPEDVDPVPELLPRQVNPRRSDRRRNKADMEAADRPDTTTRRDCNEERRLAQDSDRLEPEGRIFIPECSEEGLYRREQCHTATGYCWCVNETTGRPIPGTSTHNVMPDCTELRQRDYKVEFSGCPYSKKKKFLVELLDQLTTEMIEHAQNASDDRPAPAPDPEHTLEEQAVRWKLHMLDRNNNMILERREWKAFKEEISAERSLRRCGRNFLKYCDADEDKKINLDEWIECMGLNEPERNLPDNPNRKGPNPFSKYLRS